uniref:Putative secreted protein n=1 Tax=Anopheles marajoara TaxID=58244 RepID=A0A2M4C7S2_9DIPT
MCTGRIVLESFDFYMILVLLQLVQIIPPKAQAVLQYQPEPGRQWSTEGTHCCVQLLPTNIPHLAHLRIVRFEIDVFLQEQNVVDLMFTPRAITPIGVVDAGEIMEILGPCLGHGNA